jgi:hypothetical protein
MVRSAGYSHRPVILWVPLQYRSSARPWSTARLPGQLDQLLSVRILASFSARPSVPPMPGASRGRFPMRSGPHVLSSRVVGSSCGRQSDAREFGCSAARMLGDTSARGAWVPGDADARGRGCPVPGLTGDAGARVDRGRRCWGAQVLGCSGTQVPGCSGTQVLGCSGVAYSARRRFGSSGGPSQSFGRKDGRSSPGRFDRLRRQCALLLFWWFRRSVLDAGCGRRRASEHRRLRPLGCGGP